MSATVRRQYRPSGDGRVGAWEPFKHHETQGSVALRWRDDVLVVTPQGRIDSAAVQQVRQSVLRARGPVVVDLDDCILVEPTVFADIEAGADGADGAEDAEVCFVSRRGTCRLLLARVGVTAHFAVFHQLEDALQARALAIEGYGHGWNARS